ncbi:glutaminyl-peptide cyclotransferase [Backusella circina FSU 941]|nr:glutaminyl-peptide cyclotransferase [Backusella circina FSU 941]
MSNGTIILLVFYFICLVLSYKELPPASLDTLARAIQPNRLSVNSTLMKPLMIKRVSDTPGNAHVRDFIVSHFQDLGWEVQLDHFIDKETPLGPKEFTNIIVTLDPKSTSHLVLAAHFDSMLATDFDFIGALDSAVSCGVLMHLAETLTHLMRRSQTKTTLPLVSVQMIFFDGEEAFLEWGPHDSIYGARHLAKTWESRPRSISTTVVQKNRLDQIELFVLLDLLGTTQTKIPSYFPSTNNMFRNMLTLENKLDTLSLLNKHARNTDVPLSRMFDPNSIATFMGDYMEDDHLPFLERGVKVLHMIPYPFPSVWHKKEDTPDCIDQSVVENLAAIILCFTAEYLELEILF